MATTIPSVSLYGNSPDTINTEGRNPLVSGGGNSVARPSSSLSSLQLSYSQEVFDSVEISASARQAYSDGGTETSAQFSATWVHYEKIDLQVSYTQASGEAGRSEVSRPSLRQVMGDVREAFKSILAELRDKLTEGMEAPKRTRLSLPNPGSGNSGGPGADSLEGGSLDATTDKLLRGYLGLLRHFAKEMGSNSQIEKAIANLEAYLKGGEEGSTESVQAAESITVNVSVEVTQVTEINVNFNGEQSSEDPIVIDLDEDGVEVSDVKQGVRFDLNGDGIKEQTAFADGGDGVLVLDRNGNGVIDSGKELLGDQNGAANGFAELAQYDDNLDHAIDAKDAIFERLRVWVDRNSDGISQRAELLTLMDVGIQSIGLKNRETDDYVNGNRIAQKGCFTRIDGSHGIVADAMFNYFA